MKFKDELIEKLNVIDKDHIIESLGYHNTSDKHLSRLNKVIESSTLGIDRAHFDFKYSTNDYILKLADICGIPKREAVQYIKITLEKINNFNKAFKPYAFVNTAFVRKSEPIFILSLTESRRYIRFQDDFRLLTQLKQIETAHDIISKHYSKNDGTVTIWGDIVSYFFFYEYKKSIEISPAGIALGFHETLSQQNILSKIDNDYFL